MSLIWILVGFVGIEVVATLIHKYLMHGPLWFIHESHHRPKSRIELNDVFALIFGGLGIVLLITGSLSAFDYRFWIGLGISIYGGVYFVLHDVLVHRRMKWNLKAGSRYIKALRKAHQMHHKHVNKHPGESYGLLFFNWSYFNSEKSKL
ncbi:MAG: sterol desaturase family protein [Bacteroidia bacterium]